MVLHHYNLHGSSSALLVDGGQALPSVRSASLEELLHGLSRRGKMAPVPTRDHDLPGCQDGKEQGRRGW